MSDMAMKYEDWLRGCVYHDGRKGNVYLPCDTVLEIADWIEAHKDAVPVVRCKDCKRRYITGGTTQYYVCDFMDAEYNDKGYCHHGERKDDE